MTKITLALLILILTLPMMIFANINFDYTRKVETTAVVLAKATGEERTGKYNTETIFILAVKQKSGITEDIHVSLATSSQYKVGDKINYMTSPQSRGESGGWLHDLCFIFSTVSSLVSLFFAICLIARVIDDSAE